MANKRQILTALSRPCLQGLATKHEVSVQDRRSKDGLIEALAAARRVSASNILNALPIATLQLVCKSLGLAAGPRQKGKLVEHILGGRAVKAGTTNKTAKKAAKKAATKSPARKKNRGVRATKTASTRSAGKPARNKVTATPVSKAKARKAGGATKKAPTSAATSTRQGGAKKTAARKMRGASTATNEQTTPSVAPTDPLPPPESPAQQERVATGEVSAVVSGEVSAVVSAVTAAAASVQDVPLAPVEPAEMPMQTSPVKHEVTGDADGQAGAHRMGAMPDEARDEPNAVEPSASTPEQATPAIAAPQQSTPDFPPTPQQGTDADEVSAAAVDDVPTAVANVHDVAPTAAERTAVSMPSPVEGELSGDACNPAGERGEASASQETQTTQEAAVDEPKAAQPAEAKQDERRDSVAEVDAESGVAQDPEVLTEGQWPSAEVIPFRGHTACPNAEAEKKPAPESEPEAQQETEQHEAEGADPEVSTGSAGGSFMEQAINEVLRRKA